MLHIVAPTIAISLLLSGLGILAAWNVQQQQASVSELISLEFHNTLAAQDLLLVVNDVRQMLHLYLRSQDTEHLDHILRLKPDVEARLERLRKFAVEAEKKEADLKTTSSLAIWSQLNEGKQTFFDQLQRFRTEVQSSSVATDAARLDDILHERLQLPTIEYVKSNEQVADRTNEANRQTANKMFEAFLLLGVCGGAAGLVAGLAIARGVRRSMIKLDVSVRGAADRLQEVIGPVKISGMGSVDDIETGFRQVEDRIGVLIERLQQRELESLRSQKFAAVGQLAAGLAHELRNPLMPMKMLVQRALSRPDGPSLSIPQLKVLDEEIRRMEGLVHEFLDFAKPRALERKRIDLTTVIRQAMELVAARASVQHVSLSEKIPAGPIEIDADQLRMRQVLLNLLLNSLDAQPEGGSIHIEVELLNHSPEGMPARWVTTRVVDTGPGVDEEILEKIFEPFVSTKEFGTGLGLPISQRIMQNHGGQLTVSNTPEGGARFEVLLPLAPEESSLP